MIQIWIFTTYIIVYLMRSAHLVGQKYCTAHRSTNDETGEKLNTRSKIILFLKIINYSIIYLKFRPRTGHVQNGRSLTVIDCN